MSIIQSFIRFNSRQIAICILLLCTFNAKGQENKEKFGFEINVGIQTLQMKAVNQYIGMISPSFEPIKYGLILSGRFKYAPFKSSRFSFQLGTDYIESSTQTEGREYGHASLGGAPGGGVQYYSIRYVASITVKTLVISFMPEYKILVHERYNISLGIGISYYLTELIDEREVINSAQSIGSNRYTVNDLGVLVNMGLEYYISRRFSWLFNLNFRYANCNSYFPDGEYSFGYTSNYQIIPQELDFSGMGMGIGCRFYFF